ncbi:conserved hypothetical protein [Magnetococcus marinus MC-1]|uniref:Lipocalin-like domain-containing protein n=1 Tax=Magnetococcus marinus (strain ATCC BAA-1437 / JCM 17883 / MC-1) TaxID=156889 RepID=A0L7D4_MAGMM|nr:hypothetical protein [Magnetococcus marinus]ABK43877.1 conserved hypothetical protein [Magnetococcus marinus MC-1]ABK45200.1 conserved hypothetical protein [Magnetococcus marinus MC-1]
MAKNPFMGKWRIVHMDEWGEDYLDLVAPAHITFDKEDMGSFQFGAVQGWLDCRRGALDGEPIIEFSWQGQNDSDEACGRGWAKLTAEGLGGHLFIHASDDSPFRAVKMVGK